jgi:hypothetical protein
MTAIERAEALLEAVSLERECTDLVAYGDCAYCTAWESLDILGLNRDTLRGYIGAVKALERWDTLTDEYARTRDGDDEYEEERAFERLTAEDPDARTVIADFERLFPETNEE